MNPNVAGNAKYVYSSSDNSLLRMLCLKAAGVNLPLQANLSDVPEKKCCCSDRFIMRKGFVTKL